MTAQEFIKKYPDSEINENCLEDVACPHCGNRSRFRISAVTTFTMTDAGEDDHSDIEYDYNSYAHCEECNTPGVYSEFMVDGLDDLLRQAADHEVEQTEAFNKYGMQV